MLGSESEQARDVPAKASQQLRFVVAGLFVGALTAAVLLAIAPASPILPVVSLIRAVFYSSTVFLVAGGTTFLTLRKRVSPQGRNVALRTAMTAIWLAPLAAALEQRSPFALVPWVVFCVECARLIGFLRSPANDVPSGQSSAPVLLPPNMNWKPTLLSVTAAFLFQSAMVTAVSLHTIGAVFLGILSSITLVWRGMWMVEASPPAKPRYSARKIFNILSTATTLILFIWSPYFLPHGNLRSLAALWKFFAGAPSQTLRTSTAEPNGGADGGGSPLVAGPVFPGVILYPQLKPRAALIAPPPQSIGGAGTAHTEPLSIPFNGVYWYWSFPEEKLPATAVRKRGAPDQMSFRSTDGASLWMEAHQNLATAIALKCCRAIQVVIDNADAQPKAIGMELLLRNNAVTGKPFLSLGTQKVSPRAPANADAPIAQTVTYDIPSEMKVGKFDEVKVVFHLEWRRRDKSAKVAINRFILIPVS